MTWIDVGTDCWAVYEYNGLYTNAARTSRSNDICTNATIITEWNTGNDSTCRRVALNREKRFLYPDFSGYGLIPPDRAEFRVVNYKPVYLAALILAVVVLIANSVYQGVLAVIHEWRWNKHLRQDVSLRKLCTAAFRGVFLLESVYQTSRLCTNEDYKQLQHANAALLRMRLAELVIKTPSTALSLFVFFITILDQSYSLGLMPDFSGGNISGQEVVGIIRLRLPHLKFLFVCSSCPLCLA